MKSEKIQTGEAIVPQYKWKFIADDGTPFDNEEDARDHDFATGLKDSGIREICRTYGEYHSWYFLETQAQADRLCKLLEQKYRSLMCGEIRIEHPDWYGTRVRDGGDSHDWLQRKSLREIEFEHEGLLAALRNAM